MILDGEHVRLSYFVAGEGAPVTLLHGFTQSRRSWNELISRMPSGWSWIVPDLRGHGDTRMSDAARCTMDGCLSDLELLWDHLGVTQTHLVGYSMGGRLALHIAARRPERLLSLLTIGAHAGLEPDAREQRRRDDEALAERIERDGIEAFVDYWMSLPMFDGLRTEEIRAERLKNTTAGLACSLRGMGAGAMEPVWDELAGLELPCTFVAGQRDERFVSFAARLAATVANGRVEIVSGAGHAVHLEAPDAFARILSDHLALSTASRDSSSTRH